MALVVCWYDFICFGIVAAAFVGSLWVLWRKELAAKRDDKLVYESLLVARPDDHSGDGYVNDLPENHVGSSQLWTSCWKGLHPGWLLATRFGSFLTLAGFLSWDLVDWDATIFVYYTEIIRPMKNHWAYQHTWGLANVNDLTQKIRQEKGATKNVKEAEPLCLEQLWKPEWRYVHPFWLLWYRVVAFVFLYPMLFEIVAVDRAFALHFYTQWTFALVMVYFAVGTVVSAYGCWLISMKPVSKNEATDEFLSRNVEEAEMTNSVIYRQKCIRGIIKLQSHYTEEAIRQRAGFWGCLMQTIYQTSAGAVILTDIVFWCIIVPFGSNAHLGLNALMGCMHTLNAVLLVLDTALNSLPFPWFRLMYFVQWSCIYVVFQWVIHALGCSWWPYPFLELDTPWAPLWYFALAVVHIPCYGIYALIVKAKNSIFTRWFPRAFVRSF